MTKQEAFDKMLRFLATGTGILTSSEIHPDIPTVHDVGNRGHRLQTAGPTTHLGFGFFEAKTENGKVSFDGGGAMYRVKDENGNWLFSWTALKGNVDDLGYHFGKAISAIGELANL